MEIELVLFSPEFFSRKIKGLMNQILVTFEGSHVNPLLKIEVQLSDKIP
jgi:hypothetical protein